ncbi:MAG: hypothetical protein ACRDZ3_06940, partial [Acidimicrobiia bacterium]
MVSSSALVGGSTPSLRVARIGGLTTALSGTTRAPTFGGRIEATGQLRDDPGSSDHDLPRREAWFS